MRRRWRGTAALLALSLTVLACGGGTTPTANDPPGNGAPGGDRLSGTLVGAGATFPNPLFQEWVGAYTSAVQPMLW